MFQMRRRFLVLWRSSCACFLSFLAVALAGCTPEPPSFIISGRVVYGEKPVLPDEGSSVSMTLIPQVGEDKLYDLYSTRLNTEDGSFEIHGIKTKGVPPGKYRVKFTSLSMKPSPMVNLLNQRFGTDQSPVLIDVVDDKTPIVIDLKQFAK
jgi:hypothetical protein